MVETVNQQMHEDCVKRENCQRIQQKFCFVFSFQFFLTNVMHIISTTDFPLFCSNFARKCLILLAECSFQKSPFLLEILPAEFIQAYYQHIEERLTNNVTMHVSSEGAGVALLGPQPIRMRSILLPRDRNGPLRIENFWTS